MGVVDGGAAGQVEIVAKVSLLRFCSASFVLLRMMAPLTLLPPSPGGGRGGFLASSSVSVSDPPFICLHFNCCLFFLRLLSLLLSLLVASKVPFSSSLPSKDCGKFNLLAPGFSSLSLSLLFFLLAGGEDGDEMEEEDLRRTDARQSLK